MIKKKELFFKVAILLIVVALVCPINAKAVEPRASDYLHMYSAYVYPAGWGKVQVWVSVDGTNDMDEIGALQIQLYESRDNETWTWVKTFNYNDYSGMLGYYGYILGNQLFPHMIPGYIADSQLTLRYRNMLENYLGTSVN